jgi:hypothetical protein
VIFRQRLPSFVVVCCDGWFLPQMPRSRDQRLARDRQGTDRGRRGRGAPRTDPPLGSSDLKIGGPIRRLARSHVRGARKNPCPLRRRRLAAAAASVVVVTVVVGITRAIEGPSERGREPGVLRRNGTRPYSSFLLHEGYYPALHLPPRLAEVIAGLLLRRQVILASRFHDDQATRPPKV